MSPPKLTFFIPFPHTIPGGIARVALALVTEFIHAGDRVILSVPNSEVNYFKSNLPASKNCTVEAASLAESTVAELIRNRTSFSCLFMNPESVSEELCARIGQHAPITLLVHDLYWNRHQGGEHTNLPRQGCSVAEPVLKCMSSIIVPSQTTRDELLTAFPSLSDRTTCILHAADSNITSRSNKVKVPSRREKSFTIFYPASAYGNKNHLLLFQALAQLLREGVDIKLILTGWDTDCLAGKEPLDFPRAESARQFLLDNASLLTTKIELLGYQDYKIVDHIYNASDLVVLPSLYEGFGLGLIEAVSRGIPVVCSDIPAFREQITQYNLNSFVTTFRTNELEDFVKRIKDTRMSILDANSPTEAKLLRPAFSRSWKVVAQEYREVCLARRRRRQPQSC